MKLSIYTMILPRLEVFFLEEWVEHHLMLGVDKIYIYDNGLTPKSAPRGSRYYDNVLKPTYDKLPPTEQRYKTDRKPVADYFEDYTDIQIYDKLNSIGDKYREVKIVPWRYGTDHTTLHPKSQCVGFRHCVKNNSSDWWLHNDPDEYFVLRKHESFKELINENPGTICYYFNQRRFRHRERDKATRDIYECVPKFHNLDQKTLITGKKINFFHMHNSRSTQGGLTQTLWQDDIAFFHHYVLGYGKKNWQGSGLDYTMKKYTEGGK